MELKVRAVEATEEKSVQEVEQELLEKHEEKFNDSNETTEQTPQIKMDFAEESVVKDTPKAEETSEETPEPALELALVFLQKKLLKKHQSQFKSRQSYQKKTFFHILEKDMVRKLIH